MPPVTYCITCKHFYQIDENIGECRRNPPNTLNTKNVKILEKVFGWYLLGYVVVAIDNPSCGEYKT